MGYVVAIKYYTKLFSEVGSSPHFSRRKDLITKRTMLKPYKHPQVAHSSIAGFVVAGDQLCGS